MLRNVYLLLAPIGMDVAFVFGGWRLTERTLLVLGAFHVGSIWLFSQVVQSIGLHAISEEGVKEFGGLPIRWDEVRVVVGNDNQLEITSPRNRTIIPLDLYAEPEKLRAAIRARVPSAAWIDLR